jgi:hypothetical protein
MSFATAGPAESNFVQGVLAFWDVTPCRKVSEIRRFEGTQYFIFQGSGIPRRMIETTHPKTEFYTPENFNIQQYLC